LNTGSAGDARPDILTAKIDCSELSLVHDTTNDETAHLIPGTNAGAKTALIAQFERFAASLQYHICSFFVRT
jgi:hypothetical protein